MSHEYTETIELFQGHNGALYSAVRRFDAEGHRMNGGKLVQLTANDEQSRAADRIRCCDGTWINSLDVGC